MIDKGLPLEDEINALALEVTQYRVMLDSQGFQTLEKEIEYHVAELQTQLETCDLDRVRELQGQIASFRWLREIPDKAAQQLEHLQRVLKADTTDDETSPSVG